jgi:hypothetical protein
VLCSRVAPTPTPSSTATANARGCSAAERNTSLSGLLAEQIEALVAENDA